MQCELVHRQEDLVTATATHISPATTTTDYCRDFTTMSIDSDDSNFIENGLLSYENPNYRLESELYGYKMHGETKLIDSYGNQYFDNRRSEKEIASPNEKCEKEDILSPHDPIFPEDDTPPSEKERADRDVCEKETKYNDDGSPSDNPDDETVPHVTTGPDNDLYALPVKRRQKQDAGLFLPPGWEKHEDEDGPYYWHIKSGTIQREIPVNDEKCTTGSSVPRSTTSSALDVQQLDAEKKRKEEMALKRRSLPSRADNGHLIRFFVRSLGWTEIDESELTPERSSRAVNKCIVDLSVGKNDLLDVVGRWGDGKDLFLDLDDGALKLIDPETLTTLHTQPIHTIRVWGVGRDNGSDFAYVARERATRRHMCHVFRCEAPARSIANALRDICKRIMIERTLQPQRPTDLPVTTRKHRLNQPPAFPTPMEEPRKVCRARYLGSVCVDRACGIDLVNDAVDRLSTARPPSAWPNVAVSVAPSILTITEEGSAVPLVECRVRYLSFLGIGRDVRKCAFIMHTAQDSFVAHAFHAEPSSGALCKTVEAACKLRYQKCLDAHSVMGVMGAGVNLNSCGGTTELTPPSNTSIGATLKSLVGTITGRRGS